MDHTLMADYLSIHFRLQLDSRRYPEEVRDVRAGHFFLLVDLF